MAKKIDATRGNLVKQIFIYTIPLILTTIMQNLFNITDKAIAGQMAGSIAVASIGATGTVITLILNGVIGLSTGTSIILARYVGQKNEEKIRQTIHTAISASFALGLIVALAGFFLSPIVLRAIDCPADCFDGAVIYLRIYLGAAPAFICYNYASAILRTLGDTKRPLYYITVAGIVNIALNVILCLFLDNKVLAVAIATVVAKMVSTVLILQNLCHIEGDVKLDLLQLHLDFPTFVQILRFGIPTSISNLILPLANLQIASGINSYGVEAVAGNSAAASIHNIAGAFSGGFGMATNTFIGQNLGAKNKPRVISSFWTLLWLNIAISGSIGLLLCAGGKFFIGLIVGADAAEAINYGMSRMLHVTLFTFVNAVNVVISHAFQAFGYPIFSSVSNIFFTLVLRVFWMQFIYPLNPSFDNIMLCFTVSWSLNMLLYIVFFAFIFARYVKKGICKRI
ncbi:MAG: MATE family efflux transporter [Clostridia bacterium]|nr:MATE family efflux transporter [Clostridia bacterium]